MENSDCTEDRKKPQFGTRYLNEPDKVFQHNAWDDVEWDEELKQNAEEKIKYNSQALVSEEEQEKYENEANQFWDKFYNIHENRFFKDRHWLFTEFPDLCINSEPNEDENTSENISNKASAIQEKERINIFEVGCGVGNTVFPILETNMSSNVFVYCCDFSEVAVSLVKSNSLYNSDRCCAFVCDISSDVWEVPFEENSLDFILLIFVLSAIHPEKMQYAVNRLAKYLKPGGEILFRDYGKYDMVELRFKPGRCLSQHFYVRGDGTRVYFFSEDEVHNLFTTAGLVKTQLYSSKRLQVNRGKQLKMYRIWIQAKYMKPLDSS
ncbi:tRNA N(3)-methylcytidine methyltransferase METTL2-like [Argiope bruennichi]|uniref:tRNA N(3)-methylcytidine methyltransferase METTL2-like n=1 Tax=Argiope bruennichi TaxID=94029 RepID=UPI00249546D4|nr:tRNA N(3)-methylcytidine methyltransferase METTL2-like [Argiope bruennichi]